MFFSLFKIGDNSINTLPILQINSILFDKYGFVE